MSQPRLLPVNALKKGETAKDERNVISFGFFMKERKVTVARCSQHVIHSVTMQIKLYKRHEEKKYLSFLPWD